LLACTMGLVSAADETILMEAEAFPEVGGWSIDTAFTQIVGSPYLLAHGLGRPVKDAVGKVTVRQGGSYRVWVRTKDWVAPWKAPGTPGRFQVLVNDKPLSAEFGTVGADWHWQDGGTVEMKAGESRVALHDLTGFDGRCDAILFSNQKDFTPPHGKELASARKRWAGLPAEPEDAGEFDLVFRESKESAMTKADLIAAVAAKANVSAAQADTVIQAFVDLVVESAKKGDKVSWPGFGSFATSKRQARTGRNPRTGEPVQIAASTAMKFSPSSTLKAELNPNR